MSVYCTVTTTYQIPRYATLQVIHLLTPIRIFDSDLILTLFLLLFPNIYRMCYCNTKRMCVMSLNKRSNRRAVRRRSRPRPPTLLTLKERRYLTFQHHHDALNLGCQFLYPDFTFIPSLPLPFASAQNFCETFSSPSNFFNRTPHQLNIFLSPSSNRSSQLVSFL